MHVDVINNHADLARVRASWEAVYAADPEAQYFLSWTWIADRLSQIDGRWMVLVARPDDKMETAPVAFFPLALDTRKTSLEQPIDVIVPAGSGVADYTGVICRPGHDKEALAAFARHLCTRKWDELRLRNLDCSSERVRLFTDHFSADRFIVSPLDMTNSDGVDNSICPFIPLPSSFEAYLDQLSANSRQKLRRLMRKLEADADLAITETTGETFGRDLETLLGFWSQQWADRKGDQMTMLTDRIEQTVRQAYRTGSLFMPVLRHRNEPLGMLACFLDPTKRRLLFFVSGRRTDWDGPSPGLILHAHSIRHAISQGYEIYDFLRGDEAYKFSLGAICRRICNLSIRTADARNTKESLRYAMQLVQSGKLLDAKRIAEQILDQDEANIAAMLALARVHVGLKDAPAARRLVECALQVAPDNASVWQARGGVFEIEARFDDALEAYDRAIELNPSDLMAQVSRGRTLNAMGERDEALAAFLRVRDSDPEFAGITRAIAELEASGAQASHRSSA